MYNAYLPTAIKLLLLVTVLQLLCLARLPAQSLLPVDPIAQAAAPFDQLDPSDLTTGLLAERGSPFFSLYEYSLPQTYHDSVATDASGLQMAGVTVRTMAYQGAPTNFLGTEPWREHERTRSDTVNLGGLLARYDRFDDDALDDAHAALQFRALECPGRWHRHAAATRR